MKLYKREDFIKLPRMTIYSKILDMDSDEQTGVFCKVSDLSDGCINDFVEQDLITEYGYPLNISDGYDALEYQKGVRNSFKDFKIDLYCAGRDGMYNDEDLFIVWDNSDIEDLITYLKDCIK